jgi:uncharacterized membrane protein
MAIYELIRWVDHRAEHMADAVEGAFATAPSSSMVSGGAGSLVSWDSLSREGRRNVSTALRAQLIERVVGEPAAAKPIRVYVGLESAPTEYERRDLVLRELQRTGAFDRKLPIVISPTGTGYVNYVAGEAAEYMTRGNIASVDHAVLPASVGAVAGPGGRGTSAVTDADRRHPQQARGATSRPAAAGRDLR